MKFAADENFDNDILRGLFRVLPNLDMVRIQDVGLSGIEDPEVLEWCAQEDRILLTHDVRTITKFAYDRLEAGLEMPGVFEISKRLAVSVAIQELILIATCSEPEEWANQVWFLPLK